MDDQLYEEGLKSRRRVHGDAFVDRALEVKDPGHADFQRFVTEYRWGAAWSQVVPRFTSVRSLHSGCLRPVTSTTNSVCIAVDFCAMATARGTYSL
jgi:hypothetical protein